MPKHVLTAGVLVALLHAPVAGAAAFPDVRKDHFAYDAIVSLSDRGVLTGYADGTFKPDRKVNRAEALKIIAAPFLPKSETIRAKSAEFADVPENAWYLPALQWALDRKSVIDGPPKATLFHPTRAVTKAEFLKMLFTANGVDLKAFGEIALPLGADVADPGAWYYPPLRYAVATGTTTASKSGAYGPERELTRGDVAVLLHRFSLFRDGQRTQFLLSETQREIEGVIDLLARSDARGADLGSARAILLARGALLSEPDEAVVKVAVKIAEGYRALTRAYRASQSGDIATVLKLSKDAEYLAEQAEKMSPDASSLAGQLKSYAKSFRQQAEKAR